MPSLQLSDRMLWFAHCPKAGGTSVEIFMQDHLDGTLGHLHWGWDIWWKRGGWRIAQPPCSPQHLTWEDALAQLDSPPDEVFAVVRDPFDRMLSEYRYQQTHRRGTVLGRLVARLPFSIWLRVMVKVARKNPYAFDNHFRLQSEFVPEHAKFFRLEDGLQPVFDWLASEAGAGASFRSDVKELSTDAARVAIVHDADIRLISLTFGEDFARFGYGVADHQLYPKEPIAKWRDLAAAMISPTVRMLDRCGLM